MEIDRSDRNDRYVILNLEMPVLSGTKYRQIQHEYGTENTNALRLDEVFSVPMLYLAILTPTQSGTKRLRITYLSGPWWLTRMFVGAPRKRGLHWRRFVIFD